MELSTRHRRTLAAVFARPTRADVKWPDVEALVEALGGTVTAGGRTAGSRRRLRLGERRAVLHKPHPGNVMSKGSVESLRAFLSGAGVTPRSE